jgi:hypothetical protein
METYHQHSGISNGRRHTMARSLHCPGWGPCPWKGLTMGYAPFAKPGSFRFCPACGSRNKVQAAACASCGWRLDGRRGSTPVPAAVFSHRGMPETGRSTTLRWVLGAGVAVALGAALLVRGLFGGAPIEAAGRPVETGVSARARMEAPAPPATVTGWLPATAPLLAPPPAVVPPPLPSPASGAELVPPPPPAIGEGSGDSGMVGIAPRPAKPRPLSGRSFTNDDLSRSGGPSS